VSKAAERLGCSPSTVLRLIESGELAGTRLTAKGWWRIDRESVERKLMKLTNHAEHVTDSHGVRI